MSFTDLSDKTFTYLKNYHAEMLRNQVPHDPDYARSKKPHTPDLSFPKPTITNYSHELYPQPDNPPQGWGISFFAQLHPGPRGRPGGTIMWNGVSNVYWWADFETGICGMFGAQLFPFGGML